MLILLEAALLKCSRSVLEQQEGIKRDEVDTGDYDPFAWKSDAVKYSSRNLRDPIKRDLERMYEDRIGPANASSTVPKARNKVMLDPQLYCEEKLISTPYGWHMQLMAGEGKLPHEIAMRAKSYKDSVGPLMDDFTPAPPNNGKQPRVDVAAEPGPRTHGVRRVPALPPTTCRVRGCRGYRCQRSCRVLGH